MTASLRTRADEDFSFQRLTELWLLDRPGVLWRHDIDNHLSLAVRMAELEREHGIEAIYYVHADTDEYACQDEEFSETVERILALGHRLGTHVDLHLPRDAMISDGALALACSEQRATLLERGWPVGRRVSLHRPPHDAVWRDIPGFEHALSSSWRGCYASDSRRRFRDSPEVLLLVGGRAQVLTHPCWWFLDEPEAESLRCQHEALA